MRPATGRAGKSGRNGVTNWAVSFGALEAEALEFDGGHRGRSRRPRLLIQAIRGGFEPVDATPGPHQALHWEFLRAG